MTKQIIKSVFIVLLISTSISSIAVLFYPSLTTFLKVVIGVTGIQLLFFFLYNNILRYIARLNLEKEALQLSQLAEQNRILVECQGCKVKIQIDISTILQTTMIYDK